MLSNSCRYGIRAVVYIASQPRNNGMTGIKQVSKDLGLPTPFLAKILQQLAKRKILSSSKGPHGGFSLLKDPRRITLLDIIKTIDGDEIFTDCVIHNGDCSCSDASKDQCTLHDDYTILRGHIIKLFGGKTIQELVEKAADIEKVII
jgi:Rrf2 family transcriptional regulator, iron-sulfur cluster assembly transcription factor